MVPRLHPGPAESESSGAPAQVSVGLTAPRGCGCPATVPGSTSAFLALRPLPPRGARWVRGSCTELRPHATSVGRTEPSTSCIQVKLLLLHQGYSSPSVTQIPRFNVHRTEPPTTAPPPPGIFKELTCGGTSTVSK